MEEKKDWILDYETELSYRMASAVIEKPKMSIWMILIPIILVFHIYRHQRYIDGKKEFAENYLITPRKALEEALSAVAENRPPAVDEIVNSAQIPAGTRGEYAEWVKELAGHYVDLLKAGGESLAELLRQVFHSRTNYLLFLRRLGEKERRFHAVLQPGLETAAPGAGLIISRMETAAETLRREHAVSVFP